MPTVAITGQTTFGASTTGTTTQLDNNFLLALNALNSFNQYSNYLVDFGVADAYVVAAPASTNLTLAAGLQIQFKAITANTGASSLNANGTGIKSILNVDGTALRKGQIQVGGIYSVVYDGTQYILNSPAFVSGTHATTFTWNGGGAATGSLSLLYAQLLNFVFLELPNAIATTGVGSTQLVSDTALPAAIRPVGARDFPCNSIFNNGGGVAASGILRVSSGGIITLFRDGSGATFTNASSSGIISGSSVPIIYSIT